MNPMTGLAVRRVALPAPAPSNGTWLRRRNGHCALDQPRVARLNAT